MQRQPDQTDQPTPRVSGTDWHVLGEFELPFGMDVHSIIHVWLSDILTPLDLDVNFLNKVSKSAEEAAVRAIQTETVMKYQHTHLLIYISADRPSNGGTWGFFRIMKVETTAENEDPRDHSIEFYLYLEGE